MREKATYLKAPVPGTTMLWVNPLGLPKKGDILPSLSIRDLSK